jgi:hypothetical protein
MKTHNDTNQPLLFDRPYFSVAPERCALQHDWRLVGFGPNKDGVRIYEYCCNLCNVEHIRQPEKLERKPNPLCFEEKHFWLDACGDGCCPWMICYCGAVKPIHPTMYADRIKYTHDFDGNRIVDRESIQ